MSGIWEKGKEEPKGIPEGWFSGGFVSLPALEELVQVAPPYEYNNFNVVIKNGWGENWPSGPMLSHGIVEEPQTEKHETWRDRPPLL